MSSKTKVPKFPLVFLLASAIAATSVTTPAFAGWAKGALTGGTAGALIGGLVGGRRGVSTGALIGGTVGAIEGDRRSRALGYGLGAAVIVQVCLGITTLVMAVPPGFAVAHQGGALVVLTLVTVAVSVGLPSLSGKTTERT